MTPSLLSAPRGGSDLGTLEFEAATRNDRGRASLAPFLALAGAALMVALVAALLASLLLPRGVAAIDGSPEAGMAETGIEADCTALRLGAGDHCEVREFTTTLRDGHFAVEGVTNGAIVVTGTTGTEVHVRARVVTRDAGVRSRPARDAERVGTEAEPGRFVVRSPSRGLFGGGGSSPVTVDVTLEVPRTAALSLRTTNGAIRVSGVEGAMEARSTNGAVDVAEGAGPLEIRTTNGSVRASLLRGPEQGERVSLQATNGVVELHLPDATGARLEARTTNGGIRSDFGLDYEGTRRNRASGVLGSGGGEITVRTTNGAIRILRRS